MFSIQPPPNVHRESAATFHPIGKRLKQINEPLGE